MRVTPIKEIADLEPDEKIMAVHAKIKQVYGFSAGSNDHGDWSIQNIIVADRSGEIKVKIKDHDEIPKAWKGRDILIECTKHDKHGWIGVKTADDTYKGKTTRIVSISRTGKLGLADETSEEPAPPRRVDRDEERGEEHEPRHQRPPEKEERTAADAFDDALVKKAEKVWDKIKIHVGAVGIKDKTLPELNQGQLAWLANSWLARANKDDEQDMMLVASMLAMKKAAANRAPASDETPGNKLPLDRVDDNKQPATAGSPEAIMEVKRSMVQRANLMKLAVRATRTIVAPEFKDMSNEQFQSLLGQIYIGAERAGLHHRLPMVPLCETKPAEKPAEKPPKEKAGRKGEK